MTKKLIAERYTIVELQDKWKVYHTIVHSARGVPCDANPGDDCSVLGFLDWLEQEENE